MKSKPCRFRLMDRSFDYTALFLVGLIGWLCDRYSARLIAHQPEGESQC